MARGGDVGRSRQHGRWGAVLSVLCAAFAVFVGARAELRNDDIALTYLGEIAGQAPSFSLTSDGRIMFFVDAMQGGLRVFDVTDPSAFDIIGNVQTPGNARFAELSPDDSKLFVADGAAGLTIFDARDARTIALRTTVAIGTSSTEIVRAAGDKIYTAQQAGTVTIFLQSSGTVEPIHLQTLRLRRLSVDYSPVRLQVSSDQSVLCVLGDGDVGSRLFIFKRSATNSSLLEEVTSHYADGVEDIALTNDGRHLFVTVSEAPQSTSLVYNKGLNLLDVENVTSTSNLGTNGTVILPNNKVLNANSAVTSDGAKHVYLNADNTRLFVESGKFAVFRVAQTTHALTFVREQQLTTTAGNMFYPAVVLESKDKTTMYCGGGFGEDTIAILSLRPSLLFSGNVTADAPLAHLLSETNRSSITTPDGTYAVFIQRDPSLNKGIMTAIEVATSKPFIFTLDIPWTSGGSAVANLAFSRSNKLLMRLQDASGISKRYVFDIMDTIRAFAARIPEVVLQPPAPPLPPSPPPPPALGTHSVRLVDGYDEYGGRLEVYDTQRYSSGKWGTVCDSQYTFNDDEATVICRQLGFGFDRSQGADVYNYPIFGYVSDWDQPAFLDGVSCAGNESNVADCSVEQYEYVCDYSSSWYYYYYPNCYYQPSSTRISNSCCGTGCSSSSTCVQDQVDYYCNYHYNDVSIQCSPPAGSSSGSSSVAVDDGAIRLTDSNGDDSGFHGIVQVYDGGSWKIVDDSSFAANEAKVACGQLGRQSSNGPMNYSSFSSVASTPNVKVSNSCTGTESRLKLCGGSFASPTGSNGVYLSCVHDAISVTSTYSAGGRVQVDLLDEDNNRWYVIMNSSQYTIQVKDITNANAITTRSVNITNDSQTMNTVVSDLALSEDGTFVYASYYTKAVGANANKPVEEYSLKMVNVTDTADLKVLTFGSLNTVKAGPYPGSLASAMSNRTTVIITYKSFVYVVDTSRGGGDAQVVGLFISSCRHANNTMFASLSGDNQRALLTHAETEACPYREMIDLSDARKPRLLTIVNGFRGTGYSTNDTYVNSTSHDERGYYIYSENQYSAQHKVFELRLVNSGADFYAGPTRVGAEFERQLLFNCTRISPYGGYCESRFSGNVSLAGTNDALRTTGLTSETIGGDSYYGPGETTIRISGTVKKSLAGESMDLIMTTSETYYDYNSYDDVTIGPTRSVFSIEVKSSLRAAMFGKQLVLSSAEPLMSVTLTIPADVPATFVNTDVSLVQQAFDEDRKIVQLFGVSEQLNEALGKLRYHSFFNETVMENHTIDFDATDLVSPELPLAKLGVDRFRLWNLRYNAHPRLNPALNSSHVPDVRLTLGQDFAHVIDRTFFVDADDRTLAFSVSAWNGTHAVALPTWLEFDKDSLKLLGSEDSGDARHGRTRNLQLQRYELELMLEVSATDGYSTARSRFTLQLFNYAPEVLEELVGVELPVSTEKLVNMSQYFRDIDLSVGGNLAYSVRVGDPTTGADAPPWVKINSATGQITLLPGEEQAGTHAFTVIANDGLNDPVYLTLNVNVKRTQMLLVFYYLTLAVTVLGGVSSVATTYKYLWILKNITRSYDNWSIKAPHIRTVDDLANHIASYSIRSLKRPGEEIINKNIVYSMQTVQLLDSPPFYAKCLSPNIQKWLSSKPLRDGRSIPTWLEVNKQKFTFTFVRAAFHPEYEAGMRYVVLMKETDGSTLDTFDIDLSLLERGDVEAAPAPAAAPTAKPAAKSGAVTPAPAPAPSQQQYIIVGGENMTPEEREAVIKAAQASKGGGK